MDEKKTSKPKHIFNAFDITICIIILLIGSIVFIKFLDKHNSSSQATSKFYFTIEALSLDKDFENKISKGDQIRDSVHGYFYGKVCDFKSKPATKITEDNYNGTYVLADVPDKIDMEVTVECDANISDDSISVESNPIRLGKLMSLKSKGYVVCGYIIDMETE